MSKPIFRQPRGGELANTAAHLELVVTLPTCPQPRHQSPPSCNDSPPRYAAFLSYSHHDKVVAKKLQRQLETYRVPRHLVGCETTRGPVPERLTPVFRDRDELHAGADLKASVQDALARSRWLIVVCTPDAARSPWVNHEIIEFKRLHGERHVLSLIAAGEPFASQTPGREAQECFPPALRRTLTAEGKPEGELLEPISADMRKQGDGPQRAVLKLVAGIIGVGFDDLVRRDLQRRVRWLSSLAAGSVLGLVAFAGLAVVAVQARNEAQRQRVQAEGLIEFMLGDLRKKLEPVGRLEVLDSVGEKALAYYGAQESEKLDATALGQRSRALHLIGEIRDLRGNPAEAQTAFEQAASTTERLLMQAPNDGQRVFDHAQSVFWVGDAVRKRGDDKAAEAKFIEYLSLSNRLIKLDPANLDWQAEVAFANMNVGVVRLEMGRAAEALSSLQLVSELLIRLSVKRPDLIRELTESYAWRANAHEMMGDYAQALEAQQRRLTLLRSMPGGEKNFRVQRDILNALDTVSQYQLSLGNLLGAEISSKAAVQLADELVRVDPKNMAWLGDACISRQRLFEISFFAGQRPDAQKVLQQASDCVDRMNTENSLGLNLLGIKMKARATALATVLATPAQQEALTVKASQFLDESIPRLASNVPERFRLVADLANVAIGIGELQSPQEPLAARRSWKMAEDLLLPYALLQDGAVLMPLARARLYLGDAQGAKSLAQRIQRSTYRHPAYAEFEKQLHAARGGGISKTTTPGVMP